MNNGKSLTAITRKLLVHAIIQREKDEILKDVPVGSVLNDWEYVQFHFFDNNF